MKDLEAIPRRTFVKVAAAAGVSAASSFGLIGCGQWTPRSEIQDSSNDEASEDAPSTDHADIADELVYVEGSAFQMGSPESESWRGADEALHEVSVSSFYLSPYEVTQMQYLEVMGANPSANPSDSYPVENVTWIEALNFCNALSVRLGLDPAYIIEVERVTWDRTANGYRLPTEAEWEFACRAGTDTPFNTQTSINANTEANYYGTYPYDIEQNYFSQGELETRPGIYRQHEIEVGSYAPNAWGFYDMHGNVAEWVWDSYGAYDEADSQDPTGPENEMLRVCRGGGWNDFAKSLRSAYRATLPADGKSASVGFRIARNAVPLDETAVAPIPSGSISVGSKTLICFFSWSGNTRGIAQRISEQTGFLAVELELERPYSTDYNTCLEEAQHDQNVQARPALVTSIDNMQDYGTILLGYPNWWASIPMPIATFLESYNFTGKRIIPFCSHGGGRLGQSVSAISKLASSSTLGEPLSIHYSGGSTLDADISQWLDENGIEHG